MCNFKEPKIGSGSEAKLLCTSMTLALLQEAVGTRDLPRLMGRVSGYFLLISFGFTTGLCPVSSGVQNRVLKVFPATHYLLAEPLSHKCAQGGKELVPDVDNFGTDWFPQQLCLCPPATWLSCWTGICHSAPVVEGSALRGGTSPSVKEDAASCPETRVSEQPNSLRLPQAWSQDS